jgi:rhamnulose-1-phosphate aldolase/alcohol dehydrogenase
MSTSNYKHVNYLWDDSVVGAMTPLQRLTYRSNILGSDLRITNTGGGNTSSKAIEKDPLTGADVDVLWVKGSGGDLRTSRDENFASLYMDKVFSLEGIYRNAPISGVKTDIEDEMVAMYKHCTYGLNPRASSIDTPLHAFIPGRHVDHMHPNMVIAIAAAERGAQLTEEIYGDDMVWTEWQRPGFDLGLKYRDVITGNTRCKAIMMGQHGVINWADDDKACYQLTLDLIERASAFIEKASERKSVFGGMKYGHVSESLRRSYLVKLLPWLRGKVSKDQRFIGTIQTDESMMQFVNSFDAARLAELGTSCPDHFLRTKIKPLYIDWDASSESFDQLKGKIEEGLAKYVEDYQAYYNRCKHADSPAIRAAVPTVVLIPGLGMIAWGKNKSESRVTAEFYNCAIEVMRGAEAVDRYRGLPEQEAFDIEYWQLEEAKLRRMPPEQSLARQVIAVVGAGNGIGGEIAERIVPEGAHVVAADLSLEAAENTVAGITAKHGEGIGVAGSGISSCGPAIASAVNILAYGGVDSVVVTAGIFVPPDNSGHIADDRFSQTFDINVKGSYIVVDAMKEHVFDLQGLSGNVVLTTSANAVVSKKGSVAYDTSKAAANHLVRELAIELSPRIRVNAIAPATVVKGSTMFPRDRVISSLIKYSIDFNESDDDDSLRNKLAEFYAQRTLTKSPITPADQAEAAYLLLTGALSKTTGHVIPVDGGLADGFLR